MRIRFAAGCCRSREESLTIVHLPRSPGRPSPAGLGFGRLRGQLAVEDLRVQRVLVQQPLVLIEPGHRPLVQEQHAIGGQHRVHAAGDHEGQPVLPELVERGTDAPLGLVVDAAGAVVQDQDARLDQQRAGDRHALLLTARQGHAALAHVRVVAVGELGDERVRLRGAGGGLHLGVGGVRPAVGDVLADGAAEQGGLLQHDADLPAQRLQRGVADVGAVDGDAAGGDVVEARDQVDDRALARPGRADDRQGLGGSGAKAHLAQHRGADPEVAERHPLECQPFAEGRQRGGARLLPHLRLGVQDLEDPLGAGGRLRDRHHDHPQHRDREHGDDQVALERHQLADGEAFRQDLDAAAPGDDHGADVGHREHQRDGQREQARHLHHLVVEAAALGLEPLLLAPRAGERLDRADADDVLLQAGVERRDLLLDGPEPRPAHLGHVGEEHEHHGHERDHVQGQPPVGREQQREAADQQHQGGDDLDHAGADEGAHHVHVAGGAREELPGLRAVVVAERQALDVVVEPVAQIVGDALRHARGQGALQVGEQRPQRRDRDDEQRAHQDRLHARDQDARVDDLLGDARHRQIARGAGQQADQADQDAPAVGAHVAQAAQQGAHRGAPGTPAAESGATGSARAAPALKSGSAPVRPAPRRRAATRAVSTGPCGAHARASVAGATRTVPSPRQARSSRRSVRAGSSRPWGNAALAGAATIRLPR